MPTPFDSVAYYHVAYRYHDIMNPLQPETLRRLARRYFDPAPATLLDIGAGKGHGALVFAKEFGSRCTLLDSSAKWNAEAAALFASHACSHLADIRCADANGFVCESGSFDAVLCLGTGPIFGSFRDALARVRPWLSRSGVLIIGEPSIDPPVPRAYRAYIRAQEWDILDGAGLLHTAEDEGYRMLACVRSSPSDWDDYMSLQWRAISEYADAHPRDTAAIDFLDWMRDEQDVYLRYQRAHMDWNVLALSPA